MLVPVPRTYGSMSLLTFFRRKPSGPTPPDPLLTLFTGPATDDLTVRQHIEAWTKLHDETLLFEGISWEPTYKFLTDKKNDQSFVRGTKEAHFSFEYERGSRPFIGFWRNGDYRAYYLNDAPLKEFDNDGKALYLINEAMKVLIAP